MRVRLPPHDGQRFISLINLMESINVIRAAKGQLAVKVGMSD